MAGVAAQVCDGLLCCVLQLFFLRVCVFVGCVLDLVSFYMGLCIELYEHFSSYIKIEKDKYTFFHLEIQFLSQKMYISYIN